MNTAYIGVGSNIEPERYIARALALLQQQFGTLQCSSLYRSAPLGFDGPPFINAVIALKTGCGAQSLISKLKNIEQQCDRSLPQDVKGHTLDLDLLLFDSQSCYHPDLPRQDIIKFAFVAMPLAELAPNLLTALDPRSMVDIAAELAARYPLKREPMPSYWIKQYESC
ncbi:hypothetical protein VST7929_00307 [Vibrio stylophorae]|uniref:2-amino-4-hydroxy-6-hydroxymethyldihydropteridine diphosphokinase n=1 Tax=Vibrio stylophorae TaxID=659351 RepID=A0ABN8DR59_9VIBR|nr:2-amino-4-hydroxy-6-hydroxymethyldihydropteridine diphosphokinase [Vibrio stylophorae]CAH0532477.1 hypothetical protein VST7929_00307 [Vibrio stylophorae]